MAMSKERLYSMRLRSDLSKQDYELIILHYEHELKQAKDEILKLKEDKLKIQEKELTF